MANLWRLYFDVFSCNFDDWLHCEKNVTSLLFDCSLWKNIQTLDTTCHKKDFHWQFSTILTHATLPAVSFLDVRNIIYLCTLRAAQLKRWCAAEKQPVLTFNWHSPTAPRQRWLTCRPPCCRSVRKFRSFTVTFSLKHKASRRNASTDTWNWTSSGQVFIAAFLDVFSSIANTTVTVFLDLWESCLRFVGRNNCRQ